MNNEQPRSPAIWVAADTRYSRRNETGGSTHSIVTEYGPKVFEVTIACRSPSDTGFFDRVSHVQTIGLAFAGSAIAALCVFTSATTVLGNLISGDQVPSLRDVHETIVRIARAYMRPIRNEHPVEFCTIGWCPIHNANGVFLSQIGEHSDVSTTEVDLTRKPVLLLGSHKEEIGDRIYKRTTVRRSRKDLSIEHRAPLNVIREIVAECPYPDIGGSISLGILNRSRFQLYATAEPLLDDQSTSKATLKFLNHDLFEDIGLVGPCRVGIPGMT